MSVSCPHCSQSVTSLRVTDMKARTLAGGEYPAAAFACPNCQKILGTSFDSILHTEYLLKEIKKLLGK